MATETASSSMMAASEKGEVVLYRTLVLENGYKVIGPPPRLIAEELEAREGVKVIRDIVGPIYYSDNETENPPDFDTLSDIHWRNTISCMPTTLNYYNQDNEPKLEYVKVVKVLEHYRVPLGVFVTLLAKQKDAGEDTIRTYQAKLEDGKVTAFRLAPNKSYKGPPRSRNHYGSPQSLTEREVQVSWSSGGGNSSLRGLLLVGKNNLSVF